MTPGKFIISATPSARGWRRMASHVVRPERPARRLEVRRRHARRRHHEHVERQPPRARRAASGRPRRRARWRSRAGRRRPRSSRAARTARANSCGVSFDDSRWTCASMKPGTRYGPARVEPLAAVVRADAGDPPVGDGHVAVEPLARERGEDLRALDHEVGLGVAAGDGDQVRQVAHRPAMSRGAPAPAAADARSRRAAAATTAGVDEIVGGSPTPRRPYGESGSPSSRTSSFTGGMSRIVGIR